MINRRSVGKNMLSTYVDGVFVFLALSLFAAPTGFCERHMLGELELKHPLTKSSLDLKTIPFKIVYETYRETEGKKNWELFIMNADGSDQVNLTNTPDIDELYPHVSPDGTKISLSVDRGQGEQRSRSVYYMNIDGTGRVKIAENARQACWSPDGKKLAYLKGEFERYTIKSIATRGLVFYDLETGKHTEHPNDRLHHIYNICWSLDANWFLAAVHGGMGYANNIIAFEANGTKDFDLKRKLQPDKWWIKGCRPELNPDGTMLTWTETDWDVCIADIDLTSPTPRVSNVRKIINCGKEDEVYHVDFSPDGKYLAFAYGPKGSEAVGGKAPGWNICIGDLAGKWVQITTDGKHNKEPDWVPTPQ